MRDSVGIFILLTLNSTKIDLNCLNGGIQVEFRVAPRELEYPWISTSTIIPLKVAGICVYHDPISAIE